MPLTQSENEPMQYFHKRLQIASKHDSLPMLLDTLIKVAEFFYDHNDKKKALQIFTLALCYPMPPRLKNRAEQHRLNLELELSPRVVQHINAWTDTITLDQFVERLLNA